MAALLGLTNRRGWLRPRALPRDDLAPNPLAPFFSTLLGVGRVAQRAAIAVLAAVGGEQAERVLAGLAQQRARWDHWGFWHPETFAQMAADALVELQAARGKLSSVAQRRRDEVERALPREIERLFGGNDKDDRAQGAWTLIEIGSLKAVPALRKAYRSDPTRTVRDAAALALGSLGDHGMTETFVRVFQEGRGAAIDDREAKTAAYALGRLGDTRGLRVLLDAYENGYKPGVLAEALGGFGAAVFDPLLDLLDRDPALGKRKALQNLLLPLPDAFAIERLRARIERSKEGGDFGKRGAAYLKLAAGKRPVAQAIAENLARHAEGLEDRDRKALYRAARRVR